ncbi:hypothetical protein CR513_13354, partial [Mucuna pruriens]
MKAFPFSLDGATKDWMYLRLRPSGRKYVESGNTQGKHCMNIGKGSTSRVPCVYTTKSSNNFYCRLLMMDQNMVDVASGGVTMHTETECISANHRHLDQLKVKLRPSPPSHPTETEGVPTR